MVKVPACIVAVFYILLPPLHQPLYAVNFLSTFFLVGFRLDWVRVGMEAVVSDHQEKRKRKRGDVELAEFTFTVSENASTEVLKLKSIPLDFL